MQSETHIFFFFLALDKKWNARIRRLTRTDELYKEMLKTFIPIWKIITGMDVNEQGGKLLVHLGNKKLTWLPSCRSEYLNYTLIWVWIKHWMTILYLHLKLPCKIWCFSALYNIIMTITSNIVSHFLFLVLTNVSSW
jgi:hypothetical protein